SLILSISHYPASTNMYTFSLHDALPILMLFMTISVLSSSLSLRNTMQKDLKEMTPVDINLYKTANLPEVIENRFGEKTYYTELQDRKSTRLNSSHVSISYAVFCLKKKTK